MNQKIARSCHFNPSVCATDCTDFLQPAKKVPGGHFSRIFTGQYKRTTEQAAADQVETLLEHSQQCMKPLAMFVIPPLYLRRL